jgi:hypothetical protein
MACPPNRNSPWHVHQTETVHGMPIKQKLCMACPPNRNIAWQVYIVQCPLNRNTAWHRHQTETLHGHGSCLEFFWIFNLMYCNLLSKKCLKTFFREGSWKRKLQEIYFITSPRNITFQTVNTEISRTFQIFFKKYKGNRRKIRISFIFCINNT